MRRAGGRLLALSCCLSRVALAEKAAARDLDGLALVQMDHAAHREVAGVRPAYSRSGRLRPWNSPSAAEDARAFGINSSSLADTIFSDGRQDPFGTLMQFMQVLFSAVRKDSFMKAINDMSKSTAKAVGDFTENSAALGTDFETALAGDLDEEELVRLTGEFFLKEAHLMTTCYEKRSVINKRSTRAMPADVADSLVHVLSIMTSQDAIESTRSMSVNTNVPAQEFCKEAEVLMENVTAFQKGMAQTKKMINGTQKMTPMIKNYLSTMKPELVPRIVWVLNQFLEMEWAAADAMETTSSSMAGHLTPVLGKRLHCRGFRSASSPRSGMGLLVGLALAARALLALDDALCSQPPR